MIDLLRKNSELNASEVGYSEGESPEESFDIADKHQEIPEQGDVYPEGQESDYALEDHTGEPEAAPVIEEPALDPESVLQENSEEIDEARTHTLLTEENKIDPADSATARKLLEDLINPGS